MMTSIKPDPVFSMATLILVTVIALSSFGQLGDAGLPGMKCEPEYSNGACAGESSCNFTNPDNIFYLACNSDCQQNHNSKNGWCTKQDFCTCGKILRTVNKKSLQCLDIANATFWENVCVEDCQCAHNAVSGGCNFYTHGCECGVKTEKPNCPYKSSNEYFINLIMKYRSIGIDIIKIFGGMAL